RFRRGPRLRCQSMHGAARRRASTSTDAPPILCITRMPTINWRSRPSCDGRRIERERTVDNEPRPIRPGLGDFVSSRRCEGRNTIGKDLIRKKQIAPLCHLVLAMVIASRRALNPLHRYPDTCGRSWVEDQKMAEYGSK